MSQRVGWGILGTGNIARKVAGAIAKSSTGRLVSVASRTMASARAFCNELGGQPLEGYEALLKDPQVQAVYISLPNHLHAQWAIRCAEAGKHVLCEKPLTTNFPEAMYMLEKIRATGVFFMEAFMYRCHPQTAKAVQLIRDGAIGQVRVIEATFGYNMGRKLDNIRLRHDVCGGAILDVGCYTVSACRLLAGAATGKPFAEPLDLKGHAVIGTDSRVDEYATATLRFPGDIIGHVACGSQVNLANNISVFGSEGSLVIHTPWAPKESGNVMTLTASGKPAQTLTTDTGTGVYTIEIDAFGRALEEKRSEPAAPAMTMADTMGNIKTLDLWRRQVGLAFDSEKPENITTTYAAVPLKRQATTPMGYLKVPGCDKPISRVVMGTMIYAPSEYPLTFSMLDYFYEIGGNCLDLAYVYQGGNSETAVGTWINARAVREDVVLFAKGAHTPMDKPEFITPQLNTSLQRVNTSYFDFYCLHRDNPQVPVAEFVEALEEHRKAGRIRAYGGSNWTTQRIEAANEYARSKGYPGFQASSPNFSLAVWNQPMWAGCLTASDAESRKWYTQHQVPIFSWSSQASGFFAGRITAETANSTDWYQRDAYKTWFNDENFARLKRAGELAKKYGVTPTQIALAYVLNQPFPTFALIGPRTIEETRTSVQGIDLTLTADDLRFLLGE